MRRIILAVILAAASFGAAADPDAGRSNLGIVDEQLFPAHNLETSRYSGEQRLSYCRAIANLYANATFLRDLQTDPSGSLKAGELVVPLDVRKRLINKVYFTPEFRNYRGLVFEQNVFFSCMGGGPPNPAFQPLK
jgi:hypothetical protein